MYEHVYYVKKMHVYYRKKDVRARLSYVRARLLS